MDIERELLDRQLRTLMELYEHHLDLFLKWMTLYTGIVTGVLVYVVVKDPMKEVHPTSVALIVTLASAVAAVGCAIMWRWLKTLEKEVKQVAGRLGEVHYPPLLGILMTATAFFITVIFCLAALVVFYKLLSR